MHTILARHTRDWHIKGNVGRGSMVDSAADVSKASR